MKKSINFNKKLLATLVASSSLAAFHAVADDDEVVVTGIKASLIAAMDIKRNAVGVVDAINSEDIGKMPDSNLAESLQRISGLSISRNNGEGSQVTVRGIDPSLNMVTLNGRVMPAVSQNNSGDIASRAYDFSNLASETINGVEVYKTGKANIAGGGLGGNINIKTLRPLDAGNKATFGAKVVNDKSQGYGIGGAKYTPEASGLYSWVNEDKNFGVALDGAYQVRDSSRSVFQVGSWQLQTSPSVLPATATVTNGPKAGQLFNLPTNSQYQLEDIERTRKNAQLTMQYRPSDKLTGTLDYTYSENAIVDRRMQQSTWFNISAIKNISFDNGAVKSPLIYEETYGGGKDVSYAQEMLDTTTKNNSFGFNLAYQASDALKLELDFHNSSAESKTHDFQAGLNANVVTGEYADFSHDLPVMGITFNDSNPLQGNNNGILDAGDISGAMGTLSQNKQRTTVQELQLKGAYSFGDLGSLTDASTDFGVNYRKNTNLSMVGSGNSRITMGNWGGVDPDVFGGDFAGFFKPRDFGAAYPDSGSTTSNPKFLHQGFTANLSDIAKKMENMYVQALTARQVPDPANPGQMKWVDASGNTTQVNPNNFKDFPSGKFAFNGIYDTNREIDEDVKAFYLSFKSGLELGSKHANIAAGVRYEATDVTSIGAVNPPVRLQWDSDNDWTTLYSTLGAVPVIVKKKYTNILPNLDFDFGLTDDIKLRASASKTMGRAGYQSLAPVDSVGGVYLRTGGSGNPALKPMESKNVDLAVEWYYSKDSYVSVGFFQKDVTNYIGNEVVTKNLYGLRDVRKGPRFAAAVAELTADRAANVMVTNYTTTSPVLSDPNDEAQQWTRILKDMGVANPSPNNGDKIYANANDPLVNWAVTQPANNRAAKIHGSELGVQHWFGESGFGVQANYTKVSANVGFDTLKNSTTQFVMIGLGDSANLVGIFEKDALKARVAYNWRDKFINSSTAGGSQGGEPSFTRAFGEVDFSVSYDLTSNLTVSLEGLNVLGANSKNFGRGETQTNVYEDLSARYTAGIRYTF